MIDRRVVFLSVLLIVACAKREAATEPPSAASPSTAATPSASSTMTETSVTTSSVAAAPAPATAAPVAGAIATADGDEPGVTVAVKELKRGSGGTVSLKFVITNGSSKRLGFGYDFGDPDNHLADFSSVGGVTLIDAVGKKKYFVARDADGKCVCSRGLKDLEPGASINAWAKFPAPPDDVQKISVIIPHFSPMDDAPISK